MQFQNPHLLQALATVKRGSATPGWSELIENTDLELETCWDFSVIMLISASNVINAVACDGALRNKWKIYFILLSKRVLGFCKTLAQITYRLQNMAYAPLRKKNLSMCLILSKYLNPSQISKGLKHVIKQGLKCFVELAPCCIVAYRGCLCCSWEVWFPAKVDRPVLAQLEAAR